MAARAAPRRGDPLPKLEKVNAELFSLTYGAMVNQLVSDFEDVAQVNAQLETMGYNIGVRIVDEYFAKTRGPKCKSLKEALEAVGLSGFRMFLGFDADVVNVSADGKTASLSFGDTPITEFVELPESLTDLHYANILCGVIRGALEMVQFRVKCTFEKDKLWGHAQNEIKVELEEMIVDEAGEEYKDGM